MKPQSYAVGRVSQLHAIRTERFKTEHLTVQFMVPIREETAQRYALMLELLRRGTERFPTKALFHRHLDELFSSIITPFSRKAGDMHLFGFSAEFLGARFVGGGAGLLPFVTEMLAEVLFRPLLENGFFKAAFVDSEKTHLRDAIRARINHPKAYARTRCRKLLLEGEPYALSLSGEENMVDDATAENLTALWRSLLSSVAPTFFYIGSTPLEVVAEELEKHFGVLAGSLPKAQTVVSAHKGEVRYAEETAPLCQGKLAIGFRTEYSLLHKDSVAMSVLNEIYGGSAASKLFLNVREKLSLCYHCASALDLYKGVMFLSAGMKVENRERTESAALAEFEDIKKGNITDVEWQAAKRSLANAYRQIYDAPHLLADFYLGRNAIGISETVEERLSALERVTRDDVAVAAGHIAPGAVFFLRGTLAGEEDEE